MGIDVNSCDENGKTPLMDFVHQGKEEVVWGLLDIGANVNAQAKNGLTALMIAACTGRKDIVLMLLQAGADVWLTATQGLRAVDFATQGGYLEIARLLRVAETKGVQPVGSSGNSTGKPIADNPNTAKTRVRQNHAEAVSRLAMAIARAGVSNNESAMAFAQAWTCGEEFVRSASLEECLADCPFVSRYKGWQDALAAIGAVRLSQILQEIIALMSGQNAYVSPQEVHANLRVQGNRQRLQELHQEFCKLAVAGASEDLAALLHRYADEHPDEFKAYS